MNRFYSKTAISENDPNMAVVIPYKVLFYGKRNVSARELNAVSREYSRNNFNFDRVQTVSKSVNAVSNVTDFTFGNGKAFCGGFSVNFYVNDRQRAHADLQ